MILAQLISSGTVRIGVIGLGYVGLPLALEFAKKFSTVGFDIDESRIEELKRGRDRTLECSTEQLAASPQLDYTCYPEDLGSCDVYIVTVPTPVDVNKDPDLRHLIAASMTVGKVLQDGNLVIFESTVYPGCTEEDCVPVLEKESGLKFNKNFFCGYSPERINPGDKQRTLTQIIKITSGSKPEVGKLVDALYQSIIDAGTYLAPSIKVAEAAKVIENSQRDINIAFVNELAMVFHRMGIKTNDVLKAAETKWNFLPFRPGLVGGHCIGVDPYYLTQKAKQLGYHPEIILAGRRLNDNMGKEVAERVVKLMINRGHNIKESRVVVLGITFKEDCPDIRNSRVIDTIRELEDFGCSVAVFDPWADPDEVKTEYGISLLSEALGGDLLRKFDSVVVAVAHTQFKGLNFRRMVKEECVIYDLKGILPEDMSDGVL